MNIISLDQSFEQKQDILNYWDQVSDDGQIHHFCYFDIRNQETLITESILLVFSLVLCSLAVKKYCDIWRMLSDRNRNANLAYLGIMIWWLSYIAKDLYGIIIYIVYNQKQNVNDQLSWFSKLYFSLDWGNAFVLQTLLIFVPYHWMKQIAQALSAVSGNDSESGIQQNLPTTGYEGVQGKIHPLLRIYLRVRALCVIPIVLFLILSDFNIISLLSKILLSILLFDCLIIIIVLSAGIYSLKTNELLRMQLDQDEVKKLLNRNLVIIFSTGLRFAYDTFIVIYGASQNLTQDNCNLKVNTTWVALVILVLTAFLVHYLPILIILRIYTIEQKPQELTKSLLLADQ